MAHSGSLIPSIGAYTVNGLRFGFAGEDAVAAEDRNFDAGNNVYTVTGFGNGLNLLQTDGLNWLNALGLSDVLASLQANSIANSTSAVLNLAPNGAINLQSYDPVNAQFASIDFTPVTIELKVLTGTETAKIFIDPTAFSVNALTLLYDDGAGVFSSIALKPGSIQTLTETFRINNIGNTDIYLEINPAAGTYSIGPLLADNITITSSQMSFSQNLGKYQFDNCPVYSDNAAALLGGLITGMIYRDGDNLKIVH